MQRWPGTAWWRLDFDPFPSRDPAFLAEWSGMVLARHFHDTRRSRLSRKVDATMRRALLGAVFVLAMCSSQQAALAGGALIETMAPLADGSEESVKAAVIAAIETAVRGASAMGFDWIRLRDAHVSENAVVIQILATDEPDQDEVAPGTEPGPREIPQPPDRLDPEPQRPERSRLHI